MITLIASSVLLQFIAAYLSYRMIRITGKHRAWMLIAIAISIGALRRSNDLIKLLFDNGSISSDMSSEVFSLFASGCMLVGVAYIAPIFSLLKKSEEKTEAKYKYLFDNIPQKIFYKDRDSVYIAVNPSYAQDFNAVPDDFVDKTDYDFHPKELAEKYRSDDMYTMQSGKAEYDETYVLAGEERTVHTVKTPLHDDIGNVAGIMGIFWDITERKRAEEELKKFSTRNELILNSASEGILGLDSQGKVAFINPEAARLLGYPIEELSDRHGHSTWHHTKYDGSAYPESECPICWACSRGCIAGSIGDDVFWRKDGTSFPVAYTCHPLIEDSTVMGTVVTFMDITERKKVEEEIKRLNDDLLARNEQLEFANRELESFIYSTSHDLRAPLRHISGFADLLMEHFADKLDEKGKRYLFFIHNGTEKMSRLIDDLLNLSTYSRRDIGRREINVSEMAASIITELRDVYPDRSIEVHIKRGITAFADRELVEVALSNLLGNAWKFTAKTENARIELGTIEQNRKIIYYVSDNGAGFDQQYAGKMFLPFHRLHTDGEFEGTGIGLAIVDRIVRLHGGKVWAEGAQGKGATIYFSLN